MNQGCVLALTGRASDAIEMLISGIAAYRTTGATALAAILFAALGARPCGAWAIRGGLALHRRSDDSGGNNQGKVVRGRDPSNRRRNRADVAGAGRGESASAISSARSRLRAQQQAKSWELRAATSLARLWRDQGKRQRGPRSSRAGLRLVHRRLRHARFERGQGVARQPEGMMARPCLPWQCPLVAHRVISCAAEFCHYGGMAERTHRNLDL